MVKGAGPPPHDTAAINPHNPPGDLEGAVPGMVGGCGHFTAIQVRGDAVRGLGLHLSRLDLATRELFGTGLDGELVRGYIRHALRGYRKPSRCVTRPAKLVAR
jgi:hypothetical protein